MINLRKVAGFFTPLAGKIAAAGVSPSALSWSGLMLAAMSGFLFAAGRFGWAAWVGGLSGVMDVLDGQVARLSNAVSKRGAVLDSTLDRYADFFLLAGIAFHFRAAPLPFALALLSIQGSFMISYSTAKAEAVHLDPPVNAMKREKRWIWILVAALASSIFKAESVMVAALMVVAVVSNWAAAMRLYAVWKKAL